VLTEDSEAIKSFKNEIFANYLKNNYVVVTMEDRNIILLGNENIKFNGLVYYLYEGRRTMKERIEGQAKSSL
jgi:hypothetical protein